MAKERGNSMFKWEKWKRKENRKLKWEWSENGKWKGKEFWFVWSKEKWEWEKRMERKEKI